MHDVEVRAPLTRTSVGISVGKRFDMMKTGARPLSLKFEPTPAKSSPPTEPF